MRSLLFTTALAGALIGSGSMGASATQAHPAAYRPFNSAWSGRAHASLRPLPPIAGVFRVRPDGSYGRVADRAWPYAGVRPAIYGLGRHGLHRENRGAFASTGDAEWAGSAETGLGDAGRGPAVYDIRHGRLRRERRREEANAGYGDGYGYGYGYGYDPIVAGHGGYAMPARRRTSESLDRGAPAYGGQGFVSMATCHGCGPVAYQANFEAYGQGYGSGLAGDMGVYSPGAFGPGPRIIAIPAHYNVGIRHPHRHEAARR